VTVVNVRRRLSAGLQLQDGSAHARVWAPRCSSVHFVFDRTRDDQRAAVPLEPEAGGFFSGVVPHARAGDRYWFRLDGERDRPDPASRFQPEGPHGPSEIVDPQAYAWQDAGWTGVKPTGHVIYEVHVGTFTPEGTWAAAADQLQELYDFGITIIEVMPIADFPGRWGWGYDGVNLYAPTRLYGRPDDFRAFVDRAHAIGLGVILDVVYNHFGPDGNYLAEFSTDYFTQEHTTDWGEAINFHGPARDYFIENAGYWIDEFHLDGLRLDATQDIHDESPEHVLAAISKRARAAAGNRRIYLVAENEQQRTQLVRPLDDGGFGLDGVWNDDFHHAAVVALTGRREAYYTDYRGAPQEFISAAKYGYLYQGQWYAWQQQGRGTPTTGLPHTAFVTYIENHDQVANSGFGRRLHQQTSPPRHRAMTGLLLLGPGTPMLFQGQEFASSSPFTFFVDHKEELREPICRGRREFLDQFTSLQDRMLDEYLPSPVAERTFSQCKLDFSERRTHASAYALHRDLLALRRGDGVLARIADVPVDGAVLGEHAFVLRYFGGDAGDRLLVVNFGCDLDLAVVPEPLVAAPAGRCWTLVWSSESAVYGGSGTPPLDPHAAWRVPGEATLFFREVPRGSG
jgi:maltooligosyltrehalose trehalohydrolase